MTSEARRLNKMYLDEMSSAKPDTTLGRVRDVWWPSFLADYASRGPASLDACDVPMVSQKEKFQAVANAYANEKADPGTLKHGVAYNQFIKSNIGKMFERFSALVLAQALMDADAPYCILPFKDEFIRHVVGKSRRSFRVDFKFGDGTLHTDIDADVFAFSPTDPSADIFMMSMKSTLKDRFHNVAFWNLLRRAAVSDDFPEVVPADRTTLEKIKYVAVCSDFAEEQPDFGTDAGARNLLQVDASLLDGAYVTSSKARGLPRDCANHLGAVRQHAFYPYSCLFNYLAQNG